jgi:predicted nucleic acid-binding protein
MLYFADTNILLRFLNRADPDYALTRAAVRIIKARGDDVTTAAQNLAEFWNVLTVSMPHALRCGVAVHCVRYVIPEAAFVGACQLRKTQCL